MQPVPDRHYRRPHHRQPGPTGAEERLTGSRLTADVIEAAANAADDGIAFTGDAFGSAAYLAELLPIYVNRALAQIAAQLQPDRRGR